MFVVGCGSIGARHIKNLKILGVEDILAFDPRADRLAQIADRVGVTTVSNLREGWEKEPDAVLIAAPTAMHLPIAFEAAERGIHLFVEKPLANELAQVEELKRVIRNVGLISFVACNLRFHPGLLAVRRLVHEQCLGRVLSIRVEVGHYLPAWHPWEDYRSTYSAREDLGGGVILDAIHEIDYVRWLVGEVTGVFCLAGKLSSLEIDTEDSAALLLQFECGVIGEIHLDYVQRSYSRNCQAICEEGTIRWDYVDGTVRWYSAATGTWECFKQPQDWQPNQMYLDEMRHFLGCLAGSEAPQQDVVEAARVLAIALAAKASAAQRLWREVSR
jgi:predicted dehydrogenase